MSDELKPCQCGRKAIETETVEEFGFVVVHLTTIRCEGRTEDTRHIPGCNIQCTAADRDNARRIWNYRPMEDTLRAQVKVLQDLYSEATAKRERDEWKRKYIDLQTQITSRA